MAGLPLPRAAGGRIVLAVDVSPWLRPDAACSPERLFCHVYGRSRNASQFILGWPYSFVAALETGRTSWTAILDAVRLGPADDTTAVTAAQLREVVGRIIDAGPAPSWSTCSGRHSCAGSTSNTSSGCSSKHSAGPARNYARPSRPTAGPG